jgi:hypothetical protein
MIVGLTRRRLINMSRLILAATLTAAALLEVLHEDNH